MNAGTQTFCGNCNHPMHWAICGAGLVSCFCRNDESTIERDFFGNPSLASSPALTREALQAIIDRYIPPEEKWGVGLAGAILAALGTPPPTPTSTREETP